MKKVMKTMKAWLLRWLLPKAVETVKANSDDSHNINNVGMAENRNNVDDLHTRLLDFLMRRYELRYNILTEQAEYRLRGTGDDGANGQKTDWRVIDKRTQNTLVMEARAEGINGWDVDMGRLVNSHPDLRPALQSLSLGHAWHHGPCPQPQPHRPRRPATPHQKR